MRLNDAHSEACYFGSVAIDLNPEVVARFTVEGEPVTKSRARFARSGKSVHTYTPKKVTDAEAAVAAAYLSETRRTNGQDKESTFGVIAIFHLTTRQRRDVDNMLKLVMDGLTGVAWADDSQVSEVTVRKTAAIPADSARTDVLIYTVPRSWPRASAKCAECGKDFAKPPSWKLKEFCSGACRSEALRKKRERTCEHCGTEFDDAR